MNQKINKKVYYQDWGNIPYKKAWEFQKNAQESIIKIKMENRNLITNEAVETPNYIIFNEHNPVYTLGKSGKVQNLLLTQHELREKNIEYYHIERGGDITYHGPGQITGYIIIDLENFKTDLSWFIRSIEEVVIRTMSTFSVETSRIEGFTGVWAMNLENTPKKICAIGIKCTRWVSMHGFALNVNTDLSYFNNIIPCGIYGKEVTSMQQELGASLDIDEVKARLLEHFSLVFGIIYI